MVWTSALPAQSPDELVISPVLLKAMEEVEVPALLDGAVRQIVVQEGGHVDPTSVLVHMDDRNAKHKRDQAELQARIAGLKAADNSTVELAQIEVEVASASLQRANESRKRFPDTPSQAEMDQIRLRVAEANQHLERAKQDLELAHLTHDLARSSLEAANLEFDQCQIRSPIHGTVVQIFARPGEWIRQGAPVARVLQLDRLRAEAFITQKQASFLSIEGDVMVLVHDMNPQGTAKEGGKEIRAKIVFISPEVDINDDRRRVVAEVDNAQQRLAPGMRVAIRIPANNPSIDARRRKIP
ncbi:HlyD family secretion protein [Pirellula sp. SH-Sr6A]|uniref:HlyD family secretion protein n=1 Tax=Pirellula sp. SH-Sr6A TaxID=1632865 RepID=UPI00143BD44A|nr:efflux RND transporter periplasmic adaptor subunit [Pirellula sp. SH-Sr6A]